MKWIALVIVIGGVLAALLLVLSFTGMQTQFVGEVNNTTNVTQYDGLREIWLFWPIAAPAIFLFVVGMAIWGSFKKK